MSWTRYKLREAKYFLKRIQEHASAVREAYEFTDREAFEFDLSAFLSAARSVRGYLKGEYRHYAGFQEWWGSKRQDEWPNPKEHNYRTIEDQIQAANAFFENARNETIHQRLLQPVVHWGTFRGAIQDFERDEEGEIVSPPRIIIRQVGDEDESETSLEREEIKFYFNDFRDKDVVTLCTEYVDRLEALVDECETKFGQ